MAPTTSSLLSPSELSYLHTSLSLPTPIRPDSRLPTSFRPLTAETSLLPSTNGSARICFADGTEAIVGVKAEVEKTQFAGREGFGDGDSEDGGMEVDGERRGGMAKAEDKWVEVSVDMPGYQRDDDAVVVFLAAMLHEALVADGSLRQKLRINNRWHWRLYVDILLVSSPHTYPLPLLSLTAHLALLDTRLPSPTSSDENEDPLFNDDWAASLPLYPPSSRTKPPVTLLVAAVAENTFFDPTKEELAVADSVLAISISSSSSSSSSSDPVSPAAAAAAEADIKVLAIRTIDPPARVSASAAAAGAEEAEVGVWQAKRGGLGRKAVARMVGMATEKGGVGEEILAGMEAFMGVKIDVSGKDV